MFYKMIEAKRNDWLASDSCTVKDIVDYIEKGFLEKFSQWMRHKVRVVILKQWKKPRTIYRNLMKLNKYTRANLRTKVYLRSPILALGGTDDAGEM